MTVDQNAKALADRLRDAKATLDLLEAGLAQGFDRGFQLGELMREAADALDDMRYSVIAFGSVWAVEYAQNMGLPRGHLHPDHYDILARAGARMDDFIRHEIRKDL